MAVIARDTDPPTIPNLELIRLHVTPFSHNLLSAIIPPSILPSVKNISYHSLQTFPEKSYGFLDLPIADAEKIKKKLNGTILKGSKVRIEEARPSREPDTPMEIEEMTPEIHQEEVGKGSRKRKRHEKILPGVELRDRKVQRGWTAPTTESKKPDKRQKDKKDKKVIPAKSKFTSKAECLFKTSIPANVAAKLKEDASLSSALKKGKKSRNGGQEVMVHEFSKSTKHATFLRGSGVSAGSTAVSEYVDGKGWLDKDGNVVEPEISKKKRTVVAKSSVAVDVESNSSVSDTSEEEEDSSDEEVVKDPKIKTTTTSFVTREESVTSSSGSSSDDEDDELEEAETSSSESSSSEDENEAEEIASIASPISQPSLPNTSSGHPPLSLQIPSPTSPTPLQIHPLEALFKKTPQASKAAATSTPSFSFFGPDDTNDDIDTSHGPSIPMTPFTQQDFEFRGLRSAAPTPDTAHPGKSYTNWPSASRSIPRSNLTSHSNSHSNSDGEEDEEEEEAQTSRYARSPIPERSSGPSSAAKEGKGIGEGEGEGEEEATSDFQKWFYEHRGEANRAWKKRRKVVGKEKRHAENKKRRD